MILSDQSIFSPQYLETRLKFSPFLKDAWVIGHEKPLLRPWSVLIMPWSEMGRREKLNYTSYHELSQKPEVYDLVEKQIREANKSLKPAAKIHKFVNLYKEFDADDEELTRTRKLRRPLSKTVTRKLSGPCMKTWTTFIWIPPLLMKMDG